MTKPALTAEQWDEAHTWPIWIPTFGTHECYAQFTGSSLLIGGGNEDGQMWAATARHGLAALCLYGQPFGFTHEDVAFLYNEAKANAAECRIGSQGFVEEDTNRLSTIADRIAALLPPR